MTKTNVLPEWYTNYAMDILAGQKAISSRDYVERPMDRVAGFTPEEERGFGMTGTAATAYQPALNAATAATTGAMNAPGGLAAAQPYLDAAGKSSVSNIGSYMNPYNDAVINRIAELGTRNLTENIMPQIEGRYIQAGQLGFGGRGGSGTPSGMMTDTSRAVRDVSADILAQQTGALQAGYSEAAGLAGTDLSRQAGLASTAGGLTNADLSRTLAGAEQLGGLAASAQGLGLTGAKAVTDVGTAQREMGQRNLDVAYEEWLRQQGYPQEQINNALATLKGIGPAVPTATTEYGISPSGVANKSTSTAADIAAAAAAAAGIIGGNKP
jgi:hypothetical protein